MRKIMMVLMVMSVWLASQAQASVFSDSGCRIDADANGLVTISCPNPGDLAKYNWAVQYCPDIVVHDKDNKGTLCGNRLRVDVQNGTAQLDMSAVSDGQRSFNFKQNVGTWSQVLGLKAGKNIVVEMSYDPHGDGSENGLGGCHYTFVGDLPAGSYTPLDPQVCGAGGGYAKARKGGGVTGGSARVSGKGTVAIASGASSMAVAAKDSAVSQIKAGVVEIHAKNNKGTITTTTKIKQQVNTNTVRGSTMKHSKVTVKGNNHAPINCTYNYNINVQSMGKDAKADCATCHNDSVWKAAFKDPFKNHTGAKHNAPTSVKGK
jgi:hypothetical protein